MSDAKGCPRLSVAIITRDAEECIVATLDSVRNLADEIVVLDTGSLDSTIRLARQRATTVVTRPWTDDFAAARNAALESVTGDWVLWLDAGETISSTTAIDLRQFIDNAADTKTAYYLLVRTPTQGTNISGEQVARIRLHPIVQGTAFQGRVRESLKPSLESLGFKLEGLSFVIDRGHRDHDPALRKVRAERNIHLTRLAIQEEGESPRLLNCLGEALQTLGDNHASVLHFRQALEQSSPASSEMLEAYYGMLTALEGGEDERDAQLQLCMKALDTFPLDAQLLCAIGGYLQSKGQIELASRAYQIAAGHGQINLEIWHLEGLQEIATNCYAASLQLLDRDNEACEVLTAELANNPQASRLRRQLIELHVKHARRDEALAIVNQMPRSIPNREALRSAVRGACLAAESNWIAAKPYLESAFKAGCRDAICLRWLTNLYLGVGDYESASASLAEWSKVEPHSNDLRQSRSALDAAHRVPSGKIVRVDASSPLAGASVPIGVSVHQ